ncbi:MAG: M23 family metallopeptidase [Minisyncoccia bacterium]
MMTQPFGPTTNTLEPVGPNGEPHFHYGVDLVAGDDHHTYGLAIVCPFPTIAIADKTWEGAMNSLGNGIIGNYTDAEGVKHTLTFWHVSKESDPVDYAEGETMANVGNTGLVAPQPSLKDPYAGAHLHLGYQRNGVWTDPLTIFDLTTWYPGGATPQVLEMPPAEWVVAQIEKILQPFIPASATAVAPNPPMP